MSQETNPKDVLNSKKTKFRKTSKPELSKNKRVGEKPQVFVSSSLSDFTDLSDEKEKNKIKDNFQTVGEKRPKASRNLIFFRLKTKLQNLVKKEITIFPNHNLSFSFKPFL